MKLLLLALVSSGFVFTQDSYPTKCGDLLAELHRKPEHLVFLGCKPHPNEGGKPLVARYRYNALYEKAVKDYLYKTFLTQSLTPCTKDCDGTAPTLPEISFEYKGTSYAMSFQADLLGARNRAERLKIPRYVELKREMEPYP